MRQQLLKSFKNAKTEKEFQQAAFDIAAHCVWEQGDLSFDMDSDYGECSPKYHNSLGYRCSIGHLISETVPPYLENMKAVYNIALIDLVQSNSKFSINTNALDFLGKLQECHDYSLKGTKGLVKKPADRLEKFKRFMVRLAKRYGLSTVHPALRGLTS